MLDPVVVWLGDACRAIVTEMNQPFVSDRKFQVAIHFLQACQAILGGDIKRRAGRSAPDDSLLHEATDPPSVSVWRNLCLPTKTEHAGESTGKRPQRARCK